MNLDWTEEQKQFRAGLRDFILKNRRPEWTHYQRDMAEKRDLEDVLAFCRAMGDAGYLTPHWPEEYGGRNASQWEQTIISEEIWAAGEPRGAQYMNTNWIGPAIMLAGTQEQKDFFLPPIARGDAMWCQGFSEPDSGSDLASLRTAARRDGDSYVINGQKVWTSYANVADYCFLLTRTDPATTGREGITILLVPMNTPGVEVRDIPNAWTHNLYHEVYFTDVVVPVSARLGEEGEGWQLVRRALANERVGVARAECAERMIDAAVEVAEKNGVDLDAAGTAEELGMAYASCEAARALNYAAVGERISDEGGRRPRAAASRALTGMTESSLVDSVFQALGPAALERGSIAERLLLAGTVVPLAAGSLEVQLNNVARQSLNLPRS